MARTFRLVSAWSLLFLLAFWPAGAPVHGQADDGKMPQGFHLDVLAEAPAVVHPAATAFDEEGNLYVLELVPGKRQPHRVEFRYRDGTIRHREVDRKEKPDRVRRFVREDKTGRFVAAGTVLEAEAGSLLLHDGWLFLSEEGAVRRWRLEDCRKDAADPQSKRPEPKRIVQGLAGMAPGIVRGPDGWLYLICSAGDHHAEGSDGSRATVLGDAAVFRCRPDGSRVHVFATGLRRPRPAAAFDEADTLYVMGEPLADRGLRPFAVREAQDLWGDPSPVRGDPHDFAGLIHLGFTGFPADHRDRFLVSDPRRREANRWKLRPDGSWGVRALVEGIPDFHPAGMAIGPDGAVVIADPGTPNVTLLDGKKGALRRLSIRAEGEPAKTAWDRWSRLADMKEDDLLGRLGSTDALLRLKARDACVRRGAALRPGLLKVLADVELPAHARRAALSALQDLWNDAVRDAVLDRLEDPIPLLRRQCIEALALHAPPKDRGVHDALVAILEDRDPDVRRALVLALGKIAADGAGDVLVNVLRFDEGKSADFRAALLTALQRTGRDGIRQLLALADSGVAGDRDLVLEVYPALRSREAGEGLATLLKNYHLTPGQKVDLVRTYRKYRLDPPLSLKTLSEYLAWLPPIDAQANPETKVGQLQRDLIPVRLAAWSILTERGDLKEADLLLRLRGLLAVPGPLRPAVLEALAETPLAPAGALLKKVRAESPHAAERAAAGKALEVLRKQ